MIKELGLCASVPLVPHGPAKVAINLILGLCALGVKVNLNTISRYNGILDVNTPIWNAYPEKTLVGPILFFGNKPREELWERYENFVAASASFRNEVQRHIGSRERRVFVWPAGVDTERFNDSSRHFKRDCLVYFKRSDKQVLQDIEHELRQRGMTFTSLRYGSYSEEELISLCKTSRFCLLSSEWETQGIASMEIMASGLPCFVLLPPNAPKESVIPYFSEECGLWGYSLHDDIFESFLRMMDSYSPRNYVVAHHSLQNAALAYLDLLEKSHEA